MKDLRLAIKNKKINGIYLFTGEEKYLMRMYEKSFIKACMPQDFKDMNISEFEGKAASAEKIIDAAETLPFMSDKRLVAVRNSELFTTGRKDDSEAIADYFNSQYGGDNKNDSTIILFVEDNVDKRGKAYKSINKHGKVVLFSAMKENELVVWITGQFKNAGLAISSANAVYLLRTCSSNMENIAKEIEKLSSYKKTGSIEKADIDTLCTKTTEARVFDLLDAVAQKNIDLSLTIYNELLTMKETPVGILAMISRQFRLILKAKLMSQKGMSAQAIAEKLGQHPYAVKISLSQAKGFDDATLKKAALDSVSCDTNIKTGQIDGRLGVELLIIQYGI